MFFEDYRIGMAWDTAPTVIHKDKMMDFARDYDNIPLHTDEEYAKGTIFRGLIAPGVMSFMSVWVRFLELDVFYNYQNPQQVLNIGYLKLHNLFLF